MGQHKALTRVASFPLEHIRSRHGCCLLLTRSLHLPDSHVQPPHVPLPPRKPQDIYCGGQRARGWPQLHALRRQLQDPLQHHGIGRLVHRHLQRHRLLAPDRGHHQGARRNLKGVERFVSTRTEGIRVWSTGRGGGAGGGTATGRGNADIALYIYVPAFRRSLTYINRLIITVDTPPRNTCATPPSLHSLTLHPPPLLLPRSPADGTAPTRSPGRSRCPSCRTA